MVAGLSVEEPVPEVAGVAAADEPNDQDLCNKFETCASCINADEHNIKCGFCLGGFLSYEGVGKTTYKCGGYVAGQPNKFTCPEDFKTTDCRGWLCDYGTKTCHESENGQYPTQAECMVPCSQGEVMRQCNTTTKKCEECKDKSDPDCVNRAFCDTTCGKPHAACDFTTGKCSECDPAKDPDTCKLTKAACDEQCKPGAAAKCNHATGKCEKCTSGAGCVPESACNHTCTKHPPEELYGCDWTANPPKCKQEPKATTNKTACETECHAVEMGKCDFTNNTCVKCKANAGDPDCLYTMDYCKTAQKEGKCKKEKLDGLYRMIEVQKGFKKGEFDLLFKDDKLHAQYYDTKVETKEMGDVKATGSSEGGGVTFEVTNIQKGVWPFDSLFGVYHQTFGEAQTFVFLELAMSNKKITKLDDGLTGENKYYVGAGCMDHKACDFSKATPANFDFTTKFETEFARYGFFLA